VYFVCSSGLLAFYNNSLTFLWGLDQQAELLLAAQSTVTYTGIEIETMKIVYSDFFASVKATYEFKSHFSRSFRLNERSYKYSSAIWFFRIATIVSLSLPFTERIVGLFFYTAANYLAQKKGIPPELYHEYGPAILFTTIPDYLASLEHGSKVSYKSFFSTQGSFKQ